MNVKGWQVMYGRGGGGGGELGDVSQFWEMGGSIWGGVAASDGNNGIMAFGTNLLGPRSVPLGNSFRFVYMKPINRSFDHVLEVLVLNAVAVDR
jgi:hypothetical protein